MDKSQIEDEIAVFKKSLKEAKKRYDDAGDKNIFVELEDVARRAFFRFKRVNDELDDVSHQIVQIEKRLREMVEIEREANDQGEKELAICHNLLRTFISSALYKLKIIFSRLTG